MNSNIISNRYKKYFSKSAFRVGTALVLPVAVMIGCADSEDVALENTGATITPMQSVFATESDLVLAVAQRDTAAAPELIADNARGDVTPASATVSVAPESDRILYFATNDDKVASDDLSRLGQYAEYLTQHPQVMVQINGHADERGTLEHNAELSARRAQQVASALESFGVPRSQIQTAGYGEERPAVDALQWDKNRRVELEYIDNFKVSAR